MERLERPDAWKRLRRATFVAGACGGLWAALAAADPMLAFRPPAPAGGPVPGAASGGAHVAGAVPIHVARRIEPALGEVSAEPRRGPSHPAQQAISRGFELAERGAMFAARNELIRALRAIAEDLDCRNASTTRCDRLAEAFAALDEAEDFLPRGGGLPWNRNVLELAQAHECQLLRLPEDAGLLPSAAVERYRAYSIEKLREALSPVPAASWAIHGLAKVHRVLAEQEPVARARHLARALTLEQAALAIDGRNYLAANELAVLLDESGHSREALAVLQRALRISPHEALWENVARLEARCGRAAQADQARQMASALRAARAAQGSNLLEGSEGVQWLAPAQFATTSHVTPETRGPGATERQATRQNGPYPRAWR